MKDFLRENRPHDGLAYDEYLADWRREKDTEPEHPLDKDERKLRHYLRYNYERSEQVHARYEPSDKLRQALAAIDEPQLWMVLTESWCGDSAYNLPVIAEAARLSDRVTLRILPRDENLDIMDQYLTDGGRSVPKLVAFGENGEELFRWGPRPRAAQERYDAETARSDDKMDVVEGLMEHYEEDGGWRAVDAELAEAVTAAAPAGSMAANR